MKKLFGLLTALILAVVMIFPMGVFADAGGNTSNANGIPASATVYYGDVDWESNDLPDEFYVVKTEKLGTEWLGFIVKNCGYLTPCLNTTQVQKKFQTKSITRIHIRTITHM